MPNDKRTFKELLLQTIRDCGPDQFPIDSWVNLLRGAVIEEASVGVVQVWHDGDHCAGFQMHPCGPDNCGKCEALVAGDYLLIPKATA